MKNEPKKSNTGIPLVIIGLVLVGIIGGAWWLYSSSKPDPNTNRAGSPTPRATFQPNAPVGATPPNMLGSPTAAVTVEEFADFQCGSCAAAHPTLKEIQSIYGSKIRLIFRNYPLAIPAHDKAYEAAAAAEAAGMQGKFWAMQDQLFSNQQAWSQNPNYKELWAGYAEKIGLDVQRFQTDASGMAAKSRVDQDRQRGIALNVSSTPTIFINGQSIPFPEVNVAGLRKIIDAELQKVPNQPQPAAPAPSNSNTSNSSKAR
jgi:protein-disulfide isomerase